MKNEIKKSWKPFDWDFWRRYGNRLAKCLNPSLPTIERYEDGQEYPFHHFQVAGGYISEWDAKGNHLRRIHYPMFYKNIIN